MAALAAAVVVQVVPEAQLPVPAEPPEEPGLPVLAPPAQVPVLA